MDITADQALDDCQEGDFTGRDLVTVARFTEVWEAYILKSRLLADGLLASIADEHLVAMDWFYSNAIGGVRVQVPSVEAERAHAIFDAVRRGDYALDDDAQLGDASDPDALLSDS